MSPPSEVPTTTTPPLISLHEALQSMVAKLAPNEIPTLDSPAFYLHSYALAHQRHPNVPGPNPQILTNALAAATDQDRLHFAEEYAQEVLRLTNLADARYFRKCVLRKETAAFIRYHKQRDHSRRARQDDMKH